MFKQLSSFVLGAFLAFTAMNSMSMRASAYEPSVYDSLQKTRDALLDQRKHLQDVYGQVAAQIDQLQQRLSKIDTYLDQNDRALRDVETALSRTRY